MLDLPTALHDAARSGTERRPGLATGPVLTRIRRRRTARVAVESTVGVAAVGAVALGAVQLAGMRGPDPAPPASTAPAPTDEPTTPPPTSASPTAPGDDPVEPTEEPTAPAGTQPPLEDLVIGLDGLGPLAIGSTVPATPAPTDLIRWDADFCAGTEVPGRWLTSYDDVVDPDGKHWQPFSVSVFEDHVMRIDVQVAGPHTAEGIEVGSTLAQLQAAYPGLDKVRSAVDTGVPIDAWGLRDGETALVFEVSANADTPEPYWQSDELDRVVAVVLVRGVPYGQESWFSELCG